MPRHYTPRQPRPERTCERCGSTFRPLAATVRAGYGKYCGRTCFLAQQRSTVVDRVCETCGEHFQVPPSQAANRPSKYCSRACHQAAQARKAPPCPHCGAALPYYAKKYCSRACYSAAQRASFPARFWAQVDQSGADGCWLWKGWTDDNGYGMVHVPGEGLQFCHRVAWVLTNGPLPEGRIVRHFICDNPPCCRPAHLLDGTHADNSMDAKLKGRSPTGDRHWTRRRAAQQ
jgi:hypothetical protein